jgi:predicted DNA-binding transcriptional regulator AlpA
MTEKRDKRFLTFKQLRQRWGNIAPMTLERRLRDDPRFPQPIRLTGGRIRLFSEEEVEAYERAAAGRRR